MKIFGSLCGIFFLGVILFLFWWLRWQEEVAVHVDELVTQFQVLEHHWNKSSVIKSGRFKIGYKEAVASGFPFNMKVKLVKPFLRDSNGSKSFTITMPYVELVPMENTSRSFKVEYPEFADAIFKYGNMRENYYLHLSHAPELTLRKHTLRSVAVNEIGIVYPPQLVFTVDSAGRNIKIPKKFQNAGEPVWRPMFNDMRVQMDGLSRFLRSSTKGL